MGPSATAGPAALLEREHEVERVHGMLRAVGRRSGRVLVVEGAAGLGKSRLLEQARAAAPDQGVRVLSALASDLEQGYPFGVMRQLFERALLEAESGERERWLTGAAALAADVVTASPTSSGALADQLISDESYAWQHGVYWLAATCQPTRRLCSWSTTCSGATLSRRGRSRSSHAGSRGCRSRSWLRPGRSIPR